MNIAITGSTGFVGKALISRLSQDKAITLSVFDKNNHSLQSVDSLNYFVKDQDVIIHLAGLTKSTAKTTSDFYEINTLGTANLLEAISLYGRKETLFVFASTFAVYEEGEKHIPLAEDKTKTLPRDHYGLSKFLAEEIVMFYNRKANIKTRILRIANLYGPGDTKGVIYRFIKGIKEETSIVVNEFGRQTRDFIFIDDVVSAIIKTISYSGDTLLINICSGHELRLFEVLKKLELQMGKQANISYNKNSLEKGYWIGNPTKAAQLINFKSTTSIEEGLKKTIASLV